MISLLCPTRGRPARFAAMVESFRKHTDGPFEVCCWLDADDPTLAMYDRSLMGPHYVSDQGRVGSSAMWNGLAAIATGDIMMMVNDDSIMRTHGWDHVLRSSVPRDGYYVAWPHSQAAQCTNPIVSRKWYNQLAFFVPPGYRWWYCDTALQRIGAECGRLLFLPQIACEHMFALFGKAEHDATYERNDNQEERNADRKHFESQAREYAAAGRVILAAMFRAAGYRVQSVG